MLKLRIVALVLGAWLPSAAIAQPAANPGLAGIWEGTVGTLPVRACFTTPDYGTFGAYYYSAHLQLIALQAHDGAPGTYDESGEEASAGQWQNVRAAGRNLTATWAHGSRTLPVRLHRVPGGSGESGACASLDFHRPRLAGIGTVRTRGTVDGVGYTKLALDTRGRFDITVETFALDGDSAAVRRINTALSEELAGAPPRWFECVSNSLDTNATEGSQSLVLAPALLSRRWLSVSSQGDWDCGGAHPSESSGYRLFDLATGAEVQLLDWFLPTAVKREHVEGAEGDLHTLEPAFRTFLLAGWRPAQGADAECESVLREAEYWNAGLTRDGIVVAPELPHVVQACGESFTIGFDRLRPWLTPEGRAVVAALQAERR